MIKSIQKGFTLIELLVVITIIGILATGAVTTFTSQIQKARDTTRITDVKSLESSIQQFYQDTSVYPQGAIDWTSGSSTLVTDYLPTLAQDPKHDQTCNSSRCGYVYTVGSDSVGINQGAFEVSTAFENQGNVTNKANDTTDNGNDPARLEIGAGSPSSPLVTLSAQTTAFADVDITGATDTTALVVIKRGAITTK